MALLLCHLLPRPVPRLPLLAFLLAATAHGAPSGSNESYDSSFCLWEPSSCGDVKIDYPFYLYDKTPVLQGNDGSHCGYPGLGILCDDNRAVMIFDNYQYRVTNINYKNFIVSLVDQVAFEEEKSCPRVDYNVTLPLTESRLSWLFSPPNTTIYYLLLFSNCNRPITISIMNCASSIGQTAGLWPWNESLPAELVGACQRIIQVPVLQLSEYQPNGYKWTYQTYYNALRNGFRLAWDQGRRPPLCTQCEKSGGKCGYNQTGEFMNCLCSDGSVEDQTCPSDSSESGSKKIGPGVIGGVAAGGFSFLLVAGIIAFFIIRKRKQEKGVNSSSKLLKYSGSGGTPYSRGSDMESGGVQDLQTHVFSYEELEEATDGFNDNRELGDGGFGTVYKGYLKDGRVVAVKRLYNNSYRRVEQFVNEAAILSRLRHPNLVMFYGCTSSNSRELLLVYEFVANGTVADHLHGHRAPERALPWPLRLNIAVESAAALTYLHAIEPPIVHRDVKTTNILLDADFHVKVADFGLSRLFPMDVTHVSTAPQGTPGYVDPEYHQCYQLTDKSDVYSFGVVLVELISSKPAVDITRHRNEINLAGMAINKIQKSQLEELVDMELGYESDPATKKMMTMVAELAFRCLQQNGEMRPPIKEVLEVLRALQEEHRMGKDGDKDKDAGPFSPNTVHATWESRATTPNTSRD